MLSHSTFLFSAGLLSLGCLVTGVSAGAQVASAGGAETTLVGALVYPKLVLRDRPAPGFLRAVAKAEGKDGVVAAAGGRLALRTEVEVSAEALGEERSEGFARRITPREVESSAGTFGDPSRFLQTLAGVASDNDQRNDFLVRGGNPAENLFVIDNIEIPSIN